VPVDVAASGPAAIRAGARVAKRVTFNVGADPARLQHSIDTAREARRVAGLPADEVSFGAYLPVAPHRDPGMARELVKPVTAVYARFSSTRGDPTDRLDRRDASVIQDVVDHYDMSHHGHADASHLAYLTDDFVDRFGVAGTPEQCIERLSALAALGLERFFIVGPSGDNQALVGESRRLLSEVVLPGVRQATSRRVRHPA
jgi:5,10-methylenetetrahydromethanopterin reductase